MNKTENALLAKAHAMYAKRLTEKDYNAMLNCHSHSELFSYLKSCESYGKYIKMLPDIQISRVRLENVLSQTLLNEISSLCRFEKLIGEKLYGYFIMKNEIETIIYCSRHLDTEKIHDLFIIPDFYKKEQSVFGEELQKATSFQELGSMLADTPYRKIVEPVINSNVNLAVLENVLYNYLYTQTASLIQKNFKGSQKEEILDYFRFLSDMKMIEALVRLHKTYSSSPDYKANMFISIVSGFTQKQIKALMNCSDEREILEIVRSSVYKKYFLQSEDSMPIVLRTRRARVKMSVKNLRFSQNPIVCMLCYSLTAENEVKNITHIIEGIKYNLSPDEISELIVKGEC